MKIEVYKLLEIYVVNVEYAHNTDAPNEKGTLLTEMQSLFCLRMRMSIWL